MRLILLLPLLLALTGVHCVAIERVQDVDSVYERSPQDDAAASSAVPSEAAATSAAPNQAAATTEAPAATTEAAAATTQAPLEAAATTAAATTEAPAATTEAAAATTQAPIEAAATTAAPSSAAALSSAPPAASTVCVDPDLTSNPQAAYASANAGGLILDGLTALGSPAKFPQALIGMITSPSFANFDCSNLADGTNCLAPKGPAGTICSALGGTNTDAGVIVIQSYINMYNFLKNSMMSVQVAHDEISGSKFLEFMRNDITPGKDLFGQIFLQILEIAISFIPIGGIEIAVVKAAVKVFKKLLEKTIKSAIKQGNSNRDPPPLSDLQAQLDALVPAFQGAITDQHAQIFLTANPGNDQTNPQFIWLDGGVQLALTITADQLKTNMVESMKNFMLASYMGSFDAQVVRADSIRAGALGVICNKPTEISRSDGACDCFGYPGQSVFAGKLEGAQPVKPTTLTDSADVFGGIQFPQIIENAISCSLAGGNISNVNTATFLDNPTSTVPDCLFGFPVKNVDNV